MTGAVPTPSSSVGKSTTVLQLLADLLRHWRLVLGLPFVVGVVAVGVSLLLPTRYMGSATFTPETQSLQSGFAGGLLGGLAGQLLTGVPSGDGPRFYAEVLMSRTILEGVLETPYPVDQEDSGGTIFTALFAIEAETYADSLAIGVRKLRRLVRATVDIPSDLVTVNAEAPTPELAAAVANRLVELLSEFNAERRQSRARQRRIFVEGRLATSAEELYEAEETVRTFLERNRSIESSPQLQFELQARQRALNAAEEVYLTLLREFEQARVDEVNDAPVITVIDPAVPPRRKSRPRRALIVLGSSAVAVFAAVMMAFMADYIEDAKQRDAPDYRGLRASWTAVRSQLRWVLTGGRSRRSPE